MRQIFPVPAFYTVLAIAALGLALRIAAAQGGLWVDEAWSAVLVSRVRTPWDIFVSINHDNNHHLNSLWMQAIGFGAPPLALRALSIACGTATILVAAAIGARQSVTHALVAALLFAIAPILVNYGSEARGYAPMLLAGLTAILIATRWLESSPADAASGRAALLMGAVTAIGLFAQLTMLFFVGAIGAWIALTLRRRHLPGIAYAMTARVMLPSVTATILVFAGIFAAAARSRTGMQVGDYSPFTIASLHGALDTMLATTIGASSLPVGAIDLLTLVAITATFVAVRRGRQSAPLFAVAILGLPLAFVLLRIGNSGIPRYFLLSSVAILLLLADVIAGGLRRYGIARLVAALALITITVGSVFDVGVDVARRRGDIDAAIHLMRAASPGGATIHVEHLRPIAPLQVAAATLGYPLTVTEHCAGMRYAYIDPARNAPAQPIVRLCGQALPLRLVRRAGTLSGTDWAMYGATDRNQDPAGRKTTGAVRGH